MAEICLLTLENKTVISIYVCLKQRDWHTSLDIQKWYFSPQNKHCEMTHGVVQQTSKKELIGETIEIIKCRSVLYRQRL